MSAPIIWIALPIMAAILIRMIPDNKIIAGVGSGLFFLLGLGAWLLPIDTPLAIASLSIKINPVYEILGRRFILTSADAPVLALVFCSTSLWFLTSSTVGTAHRLVSVGMIITCLLIASLAVEPFLYAALLLELAVLMSIPMLSPQGQAPSRGAIRFLIFQTLAMPLILFAGWLITGVEANPGNLIQVGESAILLGLGLIFLLAIFPFFSWIPMIAEDSPSHIAGFLFWLYPTFGLLFGLRFLENYAWIRDSPELTGILQGAGSLMVVTAGVWAAFQRHAGKIMGYAAIMETGFSLLALSLLSPNNLDIFFSLLIPRAIGIGFWAYSLSILNRACNSLEFTSIMGRARSLPFTVLGIMFSSLTVLGFPLSPKYPILLSLWSSISSQSPGVRIWIGIGMIGLAIGVIRTLAILAKSDLAGSWKTEETPLQRVFISLGILILITMVMVPQWILFFQARIPGIFEQLGR